MIPGSTPYKVIFNDVIKTVTIQNNPHCHFRRDVYENGKLIGCFEDYDARHENYYYARDDGTIQTAICHIDKATKDIPAKDKAQEAFLANNIHFARSCMAGQSNFEDQAFFAQLSTVPALLYKFWLLAGKDYDKAVKIILKDIFGIKAV